MKFYQYFRISQFAREQIHLDTRNYHQNHHGPIPIQMLISQHFHYKRLAYILVGIFTLIMGIVLSSVPWLDYIILQNLRLWNGSLSYEYWQKPGVVRLTKVYIFNVTNPDSFLTDGAKPRLQEIGPFVYREDMEKVNIKFHDNGTVTYQHKKILQFVPELSVNKAQKITVPNIPLLTLSTYANNLGYFIQRTISLLLTLGKFKPFVTVTADELVFGYDDNLVALAHQFYPKRKKPMKKMGLLINRNGTLNEVHNMYTGQTGMERFGVLANLNGMDRLPYWESPCDSLVGASEGSFFPPRQFTKSNTVHIYDKDLCRILPLEYRKSMSKHGINVDLYTPPDSLFETVARRPENRCFCPKNEFCPPRGLQNISPCQFDAPVYLSHPHFYDADESLLEAVDGLRPDARRHRSYFKIQPKLGVPVEGKVRAQLNLKVDQSPNVGAVANFPSIVFPIMWVEEGIDDVTPAIRRWMYLATTFADVACPLMTYGCIFFGTCIVLGVFINAYKSILFTKEQIRVGVRTLYSTNRTRRRSYKNPDGGSLLQFAV